MAKNKNIGARVSIKKLLVEISPKVKWRYLKNVTGIITERGSHEQYYHTSSGLHTHVNKHLIENDCWPNYAIKLDDDIVDIEGNNIVVICEWDLKFLDVLPHRELKPVTEARYLAAKRLIERYEKQ
jgi:hypothetical protein